MPLASQCGVKEESTYATAVTVDSFHEFVDENIKFMPGRVKVKTKRAAQRVRRGDRAVPFAVGASGTITMPVLSKSHGKFFKWALGTAAIGSVSDSAYTQTFTIGDLAGDAFTMQIDRPFNPSGTSQAFTFAGGKITSAEWSLATGESGFLSATYGVDFASQTTGTSLASASYASGAEPFTWVGAALTIGGASVEVVDATITLTNSLNTARHYLRNSSVKKEPLENAERVITFSITCDFVDLTHYNRVVATTTSGMQAATVLTVTAPTLIGVSAYPVVTFTLPQAEFDDADGVTVSSDEPIRMTLTGEATFDGTNSPLTITYKSTDSAA
jgi:hypothetical protein